MGEAEGHGEMGGGHEAPGRARRPDRELRARAELAWDRVQAVLQRRPARVVSARYLLGSVDRVPVEGYLAGITASFVASVWLDATNHRRAGLFAGLWLPLALGAGLYVKLLRESRREQQ